MPRFLIEVPHSSEHVACLRAIHALLSTGSHYVTHADWGCPDGVHKAWLIVEVDSKDDALCIVPPVFRSDTTVIELTKFSLQEARDMLQAHPGEQSG
jgi:hypothetical protein